MQIFYSTVYHQKTQGKLLHIEIEQKFSKWISSEAIVGVLLGNREIFYCESQVTENTKLICVVFSKVLKFKQVSTIPRTNRFKVHLRKVGSELEQRSVEMFTVIGKQPALPGNPDEELYKDCARNDVLFSGSNEKRNWFKKDDVHVTFAGFSKPFEAAIEKNCRVEDLPSKHPRRVKADAKVWKKLPVSETTMPFYFFIYSKVMRK